MTDRIEARLEGGMWKARILTDRFLTTGVPQNLSDLATWLEDHDASFACDCEDRGHWEYDVNAYIHADDCALFMLDHATIMLREVHRRNAEHVTALINPYQDARSVAQELFEIAEDASAALVWHAFHHGNQQVIARRVRAYQRTHFLFEGLD